MPHAMRHPLMLTVVYKPISEVTCFVTELSDQRPERDFNTVDSLLTSLAAPHVSVGPFAINPLE